MSTKITVEEALRRVEDGAAMLRLLADCAAESVNRMETSDPRAFSGIADACGNLQRLARRTRRALDVEALDTELRPRKRR